MLSWALWMLICLVLVPGASSSNVGRITPDGVAWIIVYHCMAGMSIKDICAATFRRPTTVKKIRAYYNKHGTVPSSTRKGRARRLASQEVALLKQIVDDNPDLYIDEMAAVLSQRVGRMISKSTVCDCLRFTLHYTWKKVPLWRCAVVLSRCVVVGMTAVSAIAGSGSGSHCVSG